ncbi:CBS domain-containing protein [Sorangium sp. So ce1036]|uniref:CBS domain-containing protein n=1 Tax=Sorangium sp. So ce1036 TaxID=3133328 RepID=UPI003F0C4116
MSLSRFEHGAVSAELTETAIDVARRMREFRVGCVVVTEGARAIGILTDRDLVLRVLAEGRSPAETLVSEIVTYDPTTLQQTDSIETALRIMRERGIRRLPIVRHDGKVTGIVTADDLMVLLTAELSDLGAGIRENVEATETR